MGIGQHHIAIHKDGDLAEAIARQERDAQVLVLPEVHAPGFVGQAQQAQEQLDLVGIAGAEAGVERQVHSSPP